MKTIICFMLAVFSQIGILHANSECTDAEEAFRITFTNGVLVSSESALLSKDELRKTYGSSHSGQEIEYDLAYNYTHGPFTDMVQAADQHLSQYSHEVLLWLHGVGVIPDWFLQMQQRLLQAAYVANAPELTDHVAKYRDAVLQGRKVLIVAHSQGNFYANQAHQILASSQPAIPMASIGIVSVASPANQVAGGGSHVTHHRDVIQFVPGSLATNWTLTDLATGLPADDLGFVEAHAFTGTYLSHGYDVQGQLLMLVAATLSSLQDPPSVAGSGPVTATLTWDTGQSDVDLHIFEPGGAHVFYAQLQGESGVLDVDNVTGIGPEHYYTDCNQLQVGSYRFGVNYYFDHTKESLSDPSRPVTATVLLGTPGNSSTTSVTLSQHLGNAGNGSPTLIGEIQVSRISDPGNPNRDGQLSYDIVTY